jgi:hypothetical protein
MHLLIYLGKLVEVISSSWSPPLRAHKVVALKTAVAPTWDFDEQASPWISKQSLFFGCYVLWSHPNYRMTFCQKTTCRKTNCRKTYCWKAYCWNAYCWNAYCQNAYCQNEYCRNAYCRNAYCQKTNIRKINCQKTNWQKTKCRKAYILSKDIFVNFLCSW